MTIAPARLAPTTSIADRPHQVIVQGPVGPPGTDTDGNPVQTWTNLDPPTWTCSIEPATARDLERVASATVLSTATHVLKGPSHPQLAVSSRIVFGTRVFSVTGVSDPEERHVQTIVIAVELLDAAPIVDTSWIESGWSE